MSIGRVAAVALLLAGAGFACVGSTPSAARGTAPSSLAVTTAPAVATTLEAAAAAVPTPAPSAAPGGPISSGYRITIPRLGIDLPIAEGDLQRDVEELRTPEGYAFHLPGTSLPGEVGNTYLYAHARRGMFLTLWDARRGDEVLVRGPEGQLFVYLIGEVLPRVPPADVSSTRPTASERLTLQTSTGPSPLDPRFVVVAFPLAADRSPMTVPSWRAPGTRPH